MRSLTGAVQAELAASVVRPILIAEIGFRSGVVRVWSGIGDLVWNGQVWAGVGDLGGVTPIEETGETKAVGAAFTLSGVPSSTLSAVLGDVQQGAPARLWLGFLDANGQVISSPYLAFAGQVDVPEIEEGGDTAIVTIRAESDLVDLERPRTRRYTPEDQAIDYPGDKGFDFVAALQDAEIVWGR